MSTTTITVVGNLTADPELRFSPSGAAVANFTVAVNERKKSGDRWEDDGASFYRISAWRDLGEHAAESLQKGQRVVVVGQLRTRTFTDRDGTERLSLDLTADDLGPSLRWATATTTKAERRHRPQASNTNVGNDPWAPPSDDNPPF